MVLGGALVEFLAITERIAPGFDISKRCIGALSGLFYAIDHLEPSMLAFAINDDQISDLVTSTCEWARQETTEN